ncbi:porimin [Rhineura floridana]|uniref:porimin n=1 Tax=Rhineura floridana TaxID=261503 RepID=UPI002AC86207|nr:porimin [Rhineura floridana]
MKLLMVVVLLLPICLFVTLVSSQGTNRTITTSVSPHSNSTTSLPKHTTSATTHNATNITTPAISTTTAAVHATTAAKTENGTSVKPTPSKSVAPNSTAVTSKTALPSVSVTVTPKAAAAQPASSGFSAGSFIGGIVLTLGLLAVGYVGCRTYHAKRGVQYRTIDEHDAII